jgi:hypothetical protein
MHRLVLSALAATAMGAGLPSLVGCQQVTNKVEPERVTDSTLRSDEAIEHRIWLKSTARYPNFSVTAFPDGLAYEPKPGMTPEEYAAIEDGLFFVNVVVMPFTFTFVDQPLKFMRYPSMLFPPTSTAMEPLPPSPQPVGKMAYTGYTTPPPPADTSNHSAAPTSRPSGSMY